VRWNHACVHLKLRHTSRRLPRALVHSPFSVLTGPSGLLYTALPLLCVPQVRDACASLGAILHKQRNYGDAVRVFEHDFAISRTQAQRLAEASEKRQMLAALAQAAAGPLAGVNVRGIAAGADGRRPTAWLGHGRRGFSETASKATLHEDRFKFRSYVCTVSSFRTSHLALCSVQAPLTRMKPSRSSWAVPPAAPRPRHPQRCHPSFHAHRPSSRVQLPQQLPQPRAL